MPEWPGPLAGRLVKLAANAGGNVEVLADALFGVREVFDPMLAGHAGFRYGGCEPFEVASGAWSAIEID